MGRKKLAVKDINGNDITYDFYEFADEKGFFNFMNLCMIKKQTM